MSRLSSPKGLYEQFRRVANLYFLSVAVISLFPTVSPIQPYTTWTPLTLVIGLSLLRKAVKITRDTCKIASKTRRRRNDFNGESFENLRVARLEGRQHRARGARPVFSLATIIMLDSSSDENACYVETKNLDGETNLKTKRSVDVQDLKFDRETFAKMSKG